MNCHEPPVLFDHVTYLESNVWPMLATHRASDALISALKASRTIVASTITAAELLRAPEAKRKKLAIPFCNLVTLPLLEPPLILAESAARAFMNHQTEYEVSPSDQTRTIYAVLCELTDERDVGGVDAWLASMHEDVDTFIDQIRPPKPDSQTYTRAEIIGRDDFLDLLIAFPAAQALRLRREDMRMLIQASDVWMALAGALAHTITLATSHTPKKRRRKKRTGGPDIWQLVYLGLVEVFVTNDTALLSAAMDVSRLLPKPRCVVLPQDFLDGINAARRNVCANCGCIVPTPTGSHYNQES